MRTIYRQLVAKINATSLPVKAKRDIIANLKIARKNDSVLMSRYPVNSLSDSFVFDDSPQGHRYWMSLEELLDAKIYKQ